MQIFYTDKENLKDNRWDANFWRTDLLLTIEQIKNFKYPLFKIGDIAEVSIGQSGKRTFVKNGQVRYLVIGDLLNSGINYTKTPKRIDINGYNDPLRSRLEEEDILIVISGGGSIGKISIVYDLNELINISQDISIVRLKDFPIYSTFLFLQSKWGLSQIYRFENGTGVTHLNQNEVKKIIVPKFTEELEQWCKSEFDKIKILHNKALSSQDKEDWIFVEKHRERLIDKFVSKVSISNKIK